MLRWLIVPAIICVSSAAANAQVPESPRGVSGTILSATADSVVLKLKDASIATVAMTPGWTVGTARPSNPDAIKIGDFIASIQADIGPDMGKANELRIFEPGYQPEVGTHAMPQPNTSITHGTVAAITKGAAGIELEVRYPGGSRKIIVPSDVKVTAYDLRDRALAAPGVAASAITRRGSDDIWRAGRLLIVIN